MERTLKPSLLSFNEKDKPVHDKWYQLRRVGNWFPLGLGYASLMFMRYCLNPAKTALGDSYMTLDEFGNIFSLGAFFYFVGFMINGPIVDRKGGRWGMITGVTGAVVANLLMALSIWGVMTRGWDISLYWTLLVLYAANMFFQSMGAMSIVKINMPWFHVKERGTFSAIFGVMISLGVYFAFDWGYAIMGATRAAVDMDKLSATARMFTSILPTNTGIDQNWWMFLVPALFAIIWLIPMVVWLRTNPSKAGFADFDTGEEKVSNEVLTMPQILHKIFLSGKHNVLITICAIEFFSGFTRNGVFQYYPQFAKSVGFYDSFWLTANWGLCLLICGVIGANLTGVVSDKVFGSRRGPMAMLLYGAMIVAMLMMVFSMGSNVAGHGALLTGIGVLIVAASVIGVHGILSGTAAAEFAGSKNTAKAVGIVDGGVYLGTSLQAFITGKFLTGDLTQAENWISWPVIILPAVVLGTLLSLKIYHAFPNKGKSAH